MQRRNALKRVTCILLSAGMIITGMGGTGVITSQAAQYTVQAGEIPEKAAALEELPTSVNCVAEGASIQTPKDITWEVKDGGSFYNAGSQVKVTGTITENGQKVEATILAVPRQVVYLVDANVASADNSQDFKRFSQYGDTSLLKNTVPDQAYTSGSWGYTGTVGTDIKTKGNEASRAGTKSYTGYYSPSNKIIAYKLPLEAGTYIAAGEFAGWWNVSGRLVDMKVTYTASNGQKKTETLDTGAAPGNGIDVAVGSFTIESDQEVLLSFEKKAGTKEEPVLSGFSIEKSKEELPPQDVIPVTLDGTQIDKANTFGGFGSVTCNNTSRLLLDYKALHEDKYWEIMNLLFNKESGAGINHVKIEMGADVNSSSGTEPATMRSPDEEPNVKRGAGFVFAADAKSINPDITVEILRWGEPKWTQEGIGYEEYENPKYEARYQWYRKTIDAVYETYGYEVTEVSPGQNERRKGHADDFAWIKYCAKRFNEDGANGIGAFDYRKIKIVAADLYREMNVTVDYLMKDAELRDLVDVLSDHYQISMGSADLTKLNQEYGKEIWYGESTAPMINADYRINVDPGRGGVGGSASIVAMAERFIAAYAYKNSNGYANRMTELLFQPAVGAFYEGSAYSPKQLIGAFDPWSGYYEADGGIQMVQHFMQFADNDWNYLPDACFSDGTVGDGDVKGDTSTDTRLALKDPETDDYSVIFANNTSMERKYRLTLKNMKTLDSPVNIWETRGPDAGEPFDANWFQKIVAQKQPERTNGEAIIELTVKPYSIVTLTTLLDRGSVYTSGQNSSGTQRTLLELPYRDNFDYEDSFVEERGGTPYFTTDLEGAFEVEKASDTGYVLTQKINNDNRPYNWNPWGNGSDESSQTTGTPWTVLGDHRWANYTAGIDVKLDTKGNGYGDNFAVLGVRELVHSSGAAYRGKLYADGSWELLRFGTVKAKGKIESFDAEVWHKLQMKADKNTITLFIDGEQKAEFTDKESTALTGRIVLMSGFWNTEFDNLEVLPIDGQAAAASVKLDDTSSLIKWKGNVEHKIGEGFVYYNRSYTSMPSGSSLEFTIPNGTGYDLFGESDSAKIRATVDGAPAEATTVKAGARETSYWREDLEGGSHTVKIEVLSGKLKIDGINLFAAPFTGQPELCTKDLETLIQYVEGMSLDSSSFPESLLQQVSLKLEAAREALNQKESQEKLDMARLALRNALIKVVPSDTITSVKDFPKTIAVIQNGLPELPETVVAINAAGEEVEKSVIWDSKESDFKTLWDEVQIKGTLEDTDIKVSVKAVVIPYGLTYFIDSGVAKVADNNKALGHSAFYDQVAELVQLENDCADKVYEEGSWGYIQDSKISVKGSDTVSYQTGLFESGLFVDHYDDTDIVYQLPMKAGSYQFMTGAQAYWGETHSGRIEVSYLDEAGNRQTKELGTMTVSASNNNVMFSAGAEIPTDGLVEVRIKKADTKIHCLSWLAVSEKVEAELPSCIATRQGKLPELPDTVTIGGEEKEVLWKEKKESDFNKLWSTVTVKGKIADYNIPVSIDVEVIPEDLVYFIDAGVPEDEESGAYERIQKISQGLKNEVPDKPSKEDSWGYAQPVDLGGPMGSGSGNRAQTGWYAKTGKDIVYKLPLEAGKYQFTSGYFEWWWQNRPMEAFVEYENAEGAKVVSSVGKITISEPQEYVMKSDAVIELPTDQTVTFRVKKTGSSDPVISWLAVNEVKEKEEEVWHTTKISVTHKPDKKDYEIGEEFAPAGMEVKRFEKASPSNAVREGTLEENEYETEYDFSKAGKSTVTIVYSEWAETGEEKIFKDSFQVNVKEELPEVEYYTSKIAVTRKPYKLSYKLGEDLDTAGLEVTEYQKASPSQAERKHILTEDDYDLEYSLLNTGRQKVKVIYYGNDKKGEEKRFTALFTVEVRPESVDFPYVTGIRIETEPVRKVYNQGDSFDPIGLRVKKQICNPDGSLSEEEVLAEELEFSYDFGNTGSQFVTLTYYGMDADGQEKAFRTRFTVQVTPKAWNSYIEDIQERIPDNSESEINDSLPALTSGASKYQDGTWHQDEKGWWLMGKDGTYPVNQWVEASWGGLGGWYFFDEDGYMLIGWLQYQGEYYYLNPKSNGNKGCMLTGWQFIDGKWFYFSTEEGSKKGAMLKETLTPDGYAVGADGSWIQ